MVVTSTLTLTDGLINTGTIDAQGSIVQASTFDGGSVTESVIVGIRYL